jgi:acyl-CoA thioesterase-2
MTAEKGRYVYQDMDWERRMSSALQDVLSILDLETLEVNLFRGRSPQSRWQRVFGGQVIGQALVAACRTVEDVAVRPPHSLHAYFLLGGDPKVPIIYEVDRIRDGRSFPAGWWRSSMGIRSIDVGLLPSARRRIDPSAADAGRAQARRTAERAEIRDRLLPQMPDPVRRYYEREGPIELRPVEYDRYRPETGRRSLSSDARDRPLAEPAIHQCVLAYASDMALLDAALIRTARPCFATTSWLRASIIPWFHRPFAPTNGCSMAGTPERRALATSRAARCSTTAFWWLQSLRRACCGCPAQGH